jgi:4-amino-4-deoxy-L-arabinose transferase-like glycosyltransferase
MVLWLTFNLWSLLRYPVPSCDEATYSAAAYSVVTTGRFALQLYDNLAQVGISYVVYGRLFLLGQAAVMLRAGNSLLLAARLYSLLGSLVLTAGVYLLAASIYGRRVGVWAALLLSADWAIFKQSHIGRPEIWLAAAVTINLYLVFRLRRQPGRWLALLAGLTAALLEDIHLNGLHFILALGIVTLAVLGRDRRWGLIAIYVLGGAIGTTIVIVARLMPDPSLAVSQYQTLVLGEEREFWLYPLGFHVTNFVNWLYQSYVSETSGAGIVLALLHLGGLLAAFRTSRRFESSLLVLFVLISVLSFTIVNLHKPAYYAMLWRPVLWILAVVGIIWLLEEGAVSQLFSWVKQFGAPAILSLLLAVLVAGDLYLAVKFQQVDYPAYAARLREMIPPHSRVMSDMNWFYALFDYDMIDSHYLAWASYTRQQIVPDEDALRRDYDALDIEYLITDNRFSCRDPLDPESPYEVMLAQVTEEECTPVGTVSGAWFDTSTVFRCATRP